MPVTCAGSSAVMSFSMAMMEVYSVPWAPEGESFAGLCAVDDDDGDVGGGVEASGDFEVAGGFLAGSGGGGADGETGLRGN